MEIEECEVCCGIGTYPVINKHGSTLYEMSCPQCFGSGECPPAAPPRSTAARIKSMDEMREHIAKHWRAY